MTSRATNGVRLFVLAVTAALAVCATHAEEMSLEDRIERFQLFNDCRPMYLVVEDLGSGADEIGLTRESLTAAVESRLRAARLYGEGGLTWLYLNVNVVGQAHNISLQYKRRVCHVLDSDLCGVATTWDTFGTGTHGSGGAAFIRSGVSEYMDTFLLKYLRVNEEACPGN